MSVVFVHGVPDTPIMWQPLIEALDLSDEAYVCPALPGFESKAPDGFSCTKDAYADWLISQMEAEIARTGNAVDLIGHDWGALLTLRVASLRPDLVRSFVVANAVIDPEYTGHRMAQLWNKPVLGELAMVASRLQNFSKLLKESGMPEALARREGVYWQKPMRSSILKLYRSANGLNFEGAWVDDLKNLPSKGMILWGEHDPFVDRTVGERFAAQHDYPLHILEKAGHWGIIERPDVSAALIKAFWIDPSTPVSQPAETGPADV